MRPFILTAIPENKEDKLLQSIQISYQFKIYATLWSDARITFNPEIDYDNEEVAFFLQVSSMFYTFYNNIKLNKNV